MLRLDTACHLRSLCHIPGPNHAVRGSRPVVSEIAKARLAFVSQGMSAASTGYIHEVCDGTLTADDANWIWEQTGCKAGVRQRGQGARWLTIIGPSDALLRAHDLVMRCVDLNRDRSDINPGGGGCHAHIGRWRAGQSHKFQHEQEQWEEAPHYWGGAKRRREEAPHDWGGAKRQRKAGWGWQSGQSQQGEQRRDPDDEDDDPDYDAWGDWGPEGRQSPPKAVSKAKARAKAKAPPTQAAWTSGDVEAWGPPCRQAKAKASPSPEAKRRPISPAKAKARPAEKLLQATAKTTAGPTQAVSRSAAARPAQAVPEVVGRSDLEADAPEAEAGPAQTLTIYTFGEERGCLATHLQQMHLSRDHIICIDARPIHPYAPTFDMEGHIGTNTAYIRAMFLNKKQELDFVFFDAAFKLQRAPKLGDLSMFVYDDGGTHSSVALANILREACVILGRWRVDELVHCHREHWRDWTCGHTPCHQCRPDHLRSRIALGQSAKIFQTQWDQAG